MTDDNVKRLRDLSEEWFEMCDDIHEPLTEAADRIEAQAAEIERLHRALRQYGRHLSMCDLYANSTRSCTCGLTEDLKWT